MDTYWNADDQNIDSMPRHPIPPVLEQFAKAYGKDNVAAFGSWDVLMLSSMRRDLEFIQIVLNPPPIFH